ncbi:DUF3576 domain-containing protein [Palleronia caenipelagi]|uniref:DUF3576 domain-containing protein n=1 Tax=Palleronia caenipelagi TaxID=2489174 RepID=A0A547Q0C8_9RHOB|nr:DUF3576 domain-containing protein [Palleronia caenipelagi]TRD19836.1 DUF3576 domain-containing protein [Palleronia caenipelagi]
MIRTFILPLFALSLGVVGLGGCSGGQDTATGKSESAQRQIDSFRNSEERDGVKIFDDDRETIWDLFLNVDDPDRKVEVNKYIWTAAQEVLDFLPVETVDPFSGVIVYGYGRPPGGGPAYRATVFVQDPALDARSLNVALATQAGPVNPDTTRAIEDAILTRARQLRIADGKR